MDTLSDDLAKMRLQQPAARVREYRVTSRGARAWRPHRDVDDLQQLVLHVMVTQNYAESRLFYTADEVLRAVRSTGKRANLRDYLEMECTYSAGALARFMDRLTEMGVLAVRLRENEGRTA